MHLWIQVTEHKFTIPQNGMFAVYPIPFSNYICYHQNNGVNIPVYDIINCILCSPPPKKKYQTFAIQHFLPLSNLCAIIFVQPQKVGWNWIEPSLSAKH